MLHGTCFTKFAAAEAPDLCGGQMRATRVTRYSSRSDILHNSRHPVTLWVKAPHGPLSN